jgi:hypothetical protein
MTFSEKRNPSNRALTAIIDAGLTMRRHKGREYAIQFMLAQGVAQSTVSRALSGPSRQGVHQFSLTLQQHPQ